MTDRRVARELAAQYLARGDAFGWFEALYAARAAGTASVPWADLTANPHLVSWAGQHLRSGSGLQALVVGCGLGDDAEFLTALGCMVTAFDIAPSAIREARLRFPGSPVDYQVYDLFALPQQWTGRFDLVLEAYTLQVLTPAWRERAYPLLSALLRPQGRLLAIARGRAPSEAQGAMPWPLTRAELAHFSSCGLVEESCEEYLDDEQPPVRRLRATYRRA